MITDLRSPNTYLEEKSLSFRLLENLAGAFYSEDKHTGNAFIGWPLTDVRGHNCGFERIYSRELFGKQNKRVSPGARPSDAFNLIGAQDFNQVTSAYVVGGLADAVSVYLATETPVVCVVGEANAPKVSRSILDAFPHVRLTVALDNDYAGIQACTRAELPWSIPTELGNDWSDVRQKQGLEALSQQIQSVQTPVQRFNIADLDSKEITYNYEKSLQALKKQPSDLELANYALGVAYRFIGTTPVIRDERTIVKDLVEHGVRLHADTASQILQSLMFINKKRKDNALKPITIAPALLKKHEYQVISSLKEIRCFSGHTVVKAPMGTGKTQIIGKPFAERAREQCDTFLALCHRQTLTRELTNRLGTEHYQDIPVESASTVSNLSSCINSLIKEKVSPLAAKTDSVFIDEITQVMRAVADRKSMMESPKEVWGSLWDVIERAENGVYCDADMNTRTVRFLEEIRPDEKLKIYEIKHPEDNGMTVNLVSGSTPKITVIGRLINALRRGERCILATDSKKQVPIILEAVAREIPDLPALGINADTSGNKEQRAFLNNPDQEAAKYRLIVHSPSISSGVSIEQTTFDSGFGLFYGAVTPSDAIQMMRRARTVRHWDVGLMPAVGRGMRTSAATIIRGVEQATQGTVSEFDWFVAEHEAQDNASRDDFAAGVYWQLEHQGFSVSVDAGYDDKALAEFLAQVSEDLETVRMKRILSAPVINAFEYERLKRDSDRTEDQVYQCLKFRVGQDLGLSDITEADVEFWDNGRGARRLSRYLLATRLTGDVDKEERSLILRRNEGVISEHLRAILGAVSEGAKCCTFGGTSIENTPKVQHLTLSAESTKQAIDYICQNAFSLVELSLVPSSILRETHTGSTSVVRPKNTIRFMRQVFERIGIRLSGKVVRKDGLASSDNKTNLVRAYTPKPESVKVMEYYAEKLCPQKNNQDVYRKISSSVSNGVQRVGEKFDVKINQRVENIGLKIGIPSCPVTNDTDFKPHILNKRASPPLSV